MTRIAVIADIHGHLPALEAVLADVTASGATRVIINGDVADGPFPAETVACLLALGSAATWIRGNSDRWLVEANGGRPPGRGAELDALLAWTLVHLAPDHLRRLSAMPLTHLLERPHHAPLGLCHATARHDNEMLLVDAGLAQAQAAFAGLPASTVLVGHSHMPFDRLFDRRRVINVGSVGLPYGHDGASWALIEGDTVTLRRTSYDVQAAAARIAVSGMPGADDFIRDYVLRAPGDAEALAAFREVAARQQASGDFA